MQVCMISACRFKTESRQAARRSLSETLTKKNKGSNVKAFMVKNYLSVFVNCMIENPAFDSQVSLSSPCISSIKQTSLIGY